MALILSIILFVVGFFLLVKGSSLLVTGSSSIAKKLGVPALAIGLTIVAFGTSLPEFVIGIISAFKGTTDIGLGNIIGSSLYNILVILGIAALIVPLKVKKTTVWKEIPLAFLAVLVLIILSNDRVLNGDISSALSRVDGLILVVFFGIFLYYVFEMAMHNKKEFKEKVKGKENKVWKDVLAVAIGIAALAIGGKLVVDGAVNIAQLMGVSTFLISAVVVTFGTTLPELTTSLVAAKKREMDIAVGNILGSNIFNIFWILGIGAIIRPIPVIGAVNFDLIFSLFVAALLFAFMFIGKKKMLERWQGVLFLVLYAIYLTYVIIRG